MNEPTLPYGPSPVSQIRRLHELFDRVVDLSASEREAELARIEEASPVLAKELRALLAQAARTESLLDEAPVRLGTDIDAPLPQIPGFRVYRCIGRGGSSTVYLADQEHAEFTRKVALKVIDRAFDAGSLRSVREEQRILARLEHPGIARLYDSGVTPWGQHWLAMEYVEGESILAHCNARQLSTRQRIETFLPVLDAVAYAHARGIVHRDLKPANIFVTTNDEPRLLDFGIAKLSDPTDQDETRTLRRALTPAYASPEQTRGDRTTAASDIYSLGVVLYELLAGALPRLGESDDTQPLPASVAFERRALRGDLEAILNKALRLRPEDRYDSVTAMAADLRNALAGGSVIARRGERMYRVRKFVRRRRVAIAVVLALACAGASWQVVTRWRDARPGNEFAIDHVAQPLDSETRRWLRDGADRLAHFDDAGARDSFRRATTSSKGRMPGEALAWDGLARAEESLGEVGRASEAAIRAGDLMAIHPDALPRPEAERLRARALAAKRDWNAAIAALETSFSAQPERVDIGLDLVSTLLACGRTDAADTAFGRLRQITADDDPRIDLIEAAVALQLSEFQHAAAAASRARDRATRLQATALAQRAARIHAEAIGRLDQREEARRELNSIIARDTGLGLDGEAAAARFALGPVLLRYADRSEARQVLESARAGCVRSGDRRCEISSRALLATTDGMDGKFADATRAARAALADAQRIGDRWCEAYVLSQLHVLYNWADDTTSEKAVVEPLLAALRDSGNRRLLQITLVNLTVAATESLELEKAEAYIVEAEELTRRIGSQFGSAAVDRARAYLEETRGDVDLARKSYTSAVEKARAAAVPWNVATYESDLAWLELSADRAEPAAEHAREAIAAFTKVGDMRSAAESEAVLAWVEATHGNRVAAQRHLEPLRKVTADDGSEKARFTMLNAEANVAAGSGDWRRAIALRRRMIRIATAWNSRGVVIVQEANLARALHAAGERRAVQTLIAQMLPEVEKNGLRGVARDLRALLASL